MALKIIEQLRRKITGESGAEEITEQDITDTWRNAVADNCIQELAFLACVNLIANAISKCDFLTFSGGEKTTGAESYLWNYSPNANQSSTDFLRDLIYKLYRHNEVLVVQSGSQLVIADSFCRTEYALKDNIYTQVTVGDFTFSRGFTQSEVMYWRLGNQKVRRLVNALYNSYSELISYGMTSYKKSRGTKGILTMDATASGDTRFQKSLDQLRNNGFRSFAEAESGVLSLYSGLTYSDLGSKTYSNEGTRDIRAMIDDVCDFTAKAFGIPPVLLSGQVAGIDDAVDHFLTFTIDPLADALQEEINRKRYGIDNIAKGNYLRIDTGAIRHIDKINAAANIDKLIGSGAYCINDIRLMTGDPIINEPWAWQHYLTKNYSEIETALAEMKGGEKDE